LKKGNLLEIQIEDFLLKEGVGIGEWKGKEIRVTGGIPGEKAVIKITENKGIWLQGEIIKLVEPSPYRRIPFCKHFGKCGGCAFQHIDYSYQLECKKREFLNLWRKEIKFPPPNNFFVQPSPSITSFRNKMEFVFGKDEKGEKSLGLHPKGKFWEVVNLEECPIFSEKRAPLLFEIFREYLQKETQTVYNPREHRGNLRHVVVRESKTLEELIIGIVVQEELLDSRALLSNLKSKLPGIKGVILVKNTSWSDAVKYEKINLLWGKDFVEEKLNGLTFHIPLPAFFQTNPSCASLLYNKLKEWLPFKGKGRVLDLYAGMGTIGIWIADRVGEVVSVEESLESIKWGKKNAKLNKCGEKIKFLPLRVEDFIKKGKSYLSPKYLEAIILDPPRAGITRKVRESIIHSRVKHLFYISCNPYSFIENIKYFIDAGYKPLKLGIFDFFPHTPHFEILSHFQLK